MSSEVEFDMIHEKVAVSRRRQTRVSKSGGADYIRLANAGVRKLIFAQRVKQVRRWG